MSRKHHFFCRLVSFVGLLLLAPSPVRAQECVIDADCDDFNVCTKDLCVSGLCQNTDNIAPCDDGLFCTVTDRCSGGVCMGSGTPCTPPQLCDDSLNACVECLSGADCSDGDPCTDDVCTAGFCSNPNNTAPCNDGNACTTGDTCSGGVCVSGAPTNCDDGNVCTDDACNPATGCTHTNNTAPCDDGNACTTGDTCSGGVCVGGTAPNCDDGDVCTDDACNPATGCTHANNTAPCNDGNACTTGDTCSGGLCVGGAAPNCDDGNVCTDDACNPATGCTHTNNTAPCDDGNACTTGDTCSGGVCVGGTAPNCDDGNVCTDDACNPATGCTHTSNTASCDDGNACTTGDTCSGGVCVGGPAPNCDDGNVCTNDACNPATGCTHTSNTAPCDDGNVCTTGDKCSGGVCVGGAAPNCNDGNVCTDDACNPAAGCTHTNNTAPCNDGLFCTLTDVCSGGICTGSGMPCTPPQLCDETLNACVECLSGADCDDGNPCTDEVCTAGYCSNPNNTAACDDGLFCTPTDVCSGGVCTGGGTRCTPPQLCDETVNSCVNCLSGADCGNGNPCDGMETCVTGNCVPGTPIVCDDGDPCNGTESCVGDGSCISTFSADCNGNSREDSCDIASGSADCNIDGIPDECELAGGDCDGNNILDTCDAAACGPNDLSCRDCNANGILDTCDIVNGTSEDCNANGIPDGCDLLSPGTMVLMPGGEFEMGDPFNEGDSDESPRHAVHLDDFYIDRYLVTNQSYADALNWALGAGLVYVGGGNVVYGSGNNLEYCSTSTSAPNSFITWNGSSFGVVAGKEVHPVVSVTWYGSAAYANWRSAMDGRQPSYDTSSWSCNFTSNGFRLSTEAEWEKAARGGAIGRRFPWSDTDAIQHARANYFSSSGFPYDTSPTRGYHPAFSSGVQPYTSPVGYFTPNGYGLYDMAGNVLEWCYDWYGSTYYASSPYNNPRGEVSGSSRVLRGGSWFQPAYSARCAYRAVNTPDLRDRRSGLRLALTGNATLDCNANGIPDGCDVAAGTSLDGDGNSIPDECEAHPLLLPDPTGLDKSRFISFSAPPSATAAVGETALRVWLVSLHHVIPQYTDGASIAFTLFEGKSMWVGPPAQYVESESSLTPFMASHLQCDPHYRDWSTVGLLAVTGEAIVPSSSYSVENLSFACLGQETTPPCVTGGTSVSAALTITTGRWGDAAIAFQVPTDPASQPDFDDIGALVNKFKSALGAPIKARSKLAGVDARGLMDITPDVGFDDIPLCVDAFKGLPYPYKPGKCTGDPATACTTNTDCGANGPCILCP